MTAERGLRSRAKGHVIRHPAYYLRVELGNVGGERRPPGYLSQHVGGRTGGSGEVAVRPVVVRTGITRFYGIGKGDHGAGGDGDSGFVGTTGNRDVGAEGNVK